MINSTEFSNRLKKIIDYYDETSSSFAEKIDVQRSSISHLLSGRNKPSLDFVMKVLHSYSEVDLHWFINGVGEFPKSVQPKLSETSQLNFDTAPEYNTEKSISKSTPEVSEANFNTSNGIEQIVIFYSDGTFKVYKS